jgi:hypothetical protein
MKQTRLSLLRRRLGVVAAHMEPAMSYDTTALVPTTSGSKYLQQLCKHWSHNLDVSFTPEQGEVRFPAELRGSNWPGGAVATMVAHEDNLECRISASAEGQRDILKTVVASHLDRFAFREAPLTFDWQDASV